MSDPASTADEWLAVDDPPVCSECGDDDGPYQGLCLDCLEATG